MQAGHNAYIDSYMGSCFMVTWTLFKIHLVEVDLTHLNREITALRNLTIIGFLYRNPLKQHLVESPITVDFTLPRGPVTTNMILQNVFGRPRDTSFELSLFHGHGSSFVAHPPLILASFTRKPNSILGSQRGGGLLGSAHNRRRVHLKLETDGTTSHG